MSKIPPKRELNYQKLAVAKIIEILHKKERAVLQAPTGSGKTLIVARVIEEMLFNRTYRFKKMAFLFLAPSVGSLIYQCYSKISDYLKWNWVKGFDKYYIGNDEVNKQKLDLSKVDYFEPKTVYFIGWNTLSSNSLAVRKKAPKNLFKIIEATKRQGIKLVLIVDEVHREYGAKIKSKSKKEFFTRIGELILKKIEVSATITFRKDPETFHQIKKQDVIDEEAIKREVHVLDSGPVNQNQYDDEDDINSLILQGLEKQKAVKTAYRNKKVVENYQKPIDQKPIMLVQIPDEKRKINGINIKKQHYFQKVKKILQKYEPKYGFEHGHWLSKQKSAKSRKELIAKNKVIIFKQAIATGWDVPEANILVRLRAPQILSKVFEIQTLGRILRNPLYKYYFKDFTDRRKEEYKLGVLINSGFVFTKDKNYRELLQSEDFIITTEKTISPLVENVLNYDQFYSLIQIHLLIIIQEVDEFYFLNDDFQDTEQFFQQTETNPNFDEFYQTWEVQDEDAFYLFIEEIQDTALFAQIQQAELRAEAAIKKIIYVNFHVVLINQNQYDTVNSTDSLIQQGLEQQKAVKAAYQREKINPLPRPVILIQVPDGMSSMPEFDPVNYYLPILKKILKKYASKYGFQYAFRLKNAQILVSKDELFKTGVQYDVIVFQQTSAIGWETPQANILIKLQNPRPNAEIFESQALEQILQNPLGKYYFENADLPEEIQRGKLLNNGFVFTNDKKYREYIQNQNLVVPDKDNELSPDVTSLPTQQADSMLGLESQNEKVFHQFIREMQDNKQFYRELIADDNAKSLHSVHEVDDEKTFRPLIKEMQAPKPTDKSSRKRTSQWTSDNWLLFFIYILLTIFITVVILAIIFLNI